MKRNAYVLGATVLAPLPLVFVVTMLGALTMGISGSLWLFVVLAYLAVLIPLVISYSIVRLRGWKGMWPHMGVMFAVSFVLCMLAYLPAEITPDSAVTITFDDGRNQNVPLPLAGIVIAIFAAIVNSVCMSAFWLVGVRACARFEEDTL